MYTHTHRLQKPLAWKPLNMTLIKPLIGLPVLGSNDSGPSAFSPFVFPSATKYQNNWIGIKWTENFLLPSNTTDWLKSDQAKASALCSKDGHICISQGLSDESKQSSTLAIVWPFTSLVLKQQHAVCHSNQNLVHILENNSLRGCDISETITFNFTGSIMYD